MKCPFCETKELAIMVESHLPQEERPIVMCWTCFDDFCRLVAKATGKDLKEYISIDEIHQQPERCQ